MALTAKGTFEVKLAAQPVGPEEGGPAIGRLNLDKQYSGVLAAVSHGQMISAMGTEQGSGGYTALELVEGTLDGRTGTFVLQHFGLMNRGAPELRIVVVPDSATAELAGLTGDMQIIVENGRHSYELTYSFPK